MLHPSSPTIPITVPGEPRNQRRGLSSALRMIGIVVLTATSMAMAPIFANTRAASDAIGSRIITERAALARAQRQVVESENRARTIGAQAQTMTGAADRDRATLAALALRIQSAEAGLSVVRAQTRILESLQLAQRARLAAQQRPVTELVATLQLLTRRPPITLLAQPGAARDIVHMRAMIDALLPEIRRRSVSLRAEITRSQRLTLAKQRAVAALAAATERLTRSRVELALREAQQRVRATSLAANAGLEGDRAIALGQDAEDIGDLVGTLERSAIVRDRLASLPGPAPRPGSVRRDRPGVAQPQTVGNPAYRLPVIGTVIQGLGEVSVDGTRSRGVTIATRSGAQVVAPADGRIAYAGRFRSYGSIIIIDHGGGWTTLVTNMVALSARVGDRVVQGAPIGRVGPGSPQVTIELRRAGQPIDIAALAS